jgi:hypothetical protein
MNLGLGLYRHKFTRDNFRFTRQAGATHVVAHLVDYFKTSGHNPRGNQPTGDDSGWARTEDPSCLWSLTELNDLREAMEAEGLKLETIENFDLAHWHDILFDGPKKREQLENVKTIIRRLGEARTPIMGYNFSIAGVCGRVSGTLAIYLGLAMAGQCLAAEPSPGVHVPGVIIDHSLASSKQFIGSPSIAKLEDNMLVASHDFFGPGSTSSQTAIFGSTNQGATWQKRADIEGQWWSTLFTHRDDLYIMGVGREHGFTVIRRSLDGGKTWTTPADANSGLLLGDAKYHCAPVPVVVHNGRIWRAMEDAMGPDGWGSHFRAFMMSALADSDLLVATNWSASTRLGRNPDWLNKEFGGWLEGNAVVAPDGGIVDFLRVDSRNPDERAAMIHISADGKTATFDPMTGFVNFPGGCKKFTIRFDPVSKCYWSLSNYVPPDEYNPHPERTRNTLALVRSENLRDWRVRVVLLHHPDSKTHAFQYVDWLLDGEDIIAVARTAYDDDSGGAANQHDANYLTFHRFKNFRRLGREAMQRPSKDAKN